MIIAVDYDGTLEINDNMNMALIGKLKARQRSGDIIILWTCRDGKRLNEAVTNLMRVGFRPQLVNENAPSVINQLGYNPRKVLADVYIDDKNAK